MIRDEFDVKQLNLELMSIIDEQDGFIVILTVTLRDRHSPPWLANIRLASSNVCVQPLPEFQKSLRIAIEIGRCSSRLSKRHWEREAVSIMKVTGKHRKQS